VSHQLARLRGLAVALVVLALTAGAVLASDPPPAADHGLDNAAERSGHEVLPVQAESDDSADDAADEATDEEAPAADEQSEHASGDTHGALVSEAAQMETPDAFDNHGAFVSCVARMNRGQLGPDADLSELVLADLTAEDCEGNADGEAAGAADADSADAAADDSPGKSGAAKARQASRGPRGNSPSH